MPYETKVFKITLINRLPDKNYSNFSPVKKYFCLYNLNLNKYFLKQSN